MCYSAQCLLVQLHSGACPRPLCVGRVGFGDGDDSSHTNSNTGARSLKEGRLVMRRRKVGESGHSLVELVMLSGVCILAVIIQLAGVAGCKLNHPIKDWEAQNV